MSSNAIVIILICSLVAISGALLGTFLILRRMTMLTDAISHSILFGIVAGFLVFRSMDSVPMLIAAAATGLITVWLTEALYRTRLVKEDASIGLVFPLLFSLGVVLISTSVGNIHLDIHTALVGDPTFAPLDTVQIGGFTIARSLMMMGILTAINAAFVVAFYKELKLTTFDPALATALGFAPGLVQYALMTLLSVTAVGAFDAVGAILFIGFIVVPTAAAYLLTDRLERMIALAALFGVTACIVGYFVARALDASISGCMVVALGVIFALVLIFAPHRGLLSRALLRSRQRREFASLMLVAHLLRHENQPEMEDESNLVTLPNHLHWDATYTQRVVAHGMSRGWITLQNGLVRLTDGGRNAAQHVLAR
jgi:manganese/zinc/iron transport system permease protein